RRAAAAERQHVAIRERQVSTVAPSAGRLLGSWALDPPIVGLLVTPAGLYLAGLARARSGRGRDWPSWRALSFAGGLLALAVALRHPAVHALEHAGYLAAGLLLLAPLVGSDPLPRPPGAIVRFGWLSAAMIVMAVPGALLTFSPDVRYRFYLAPARALGASALGDQHLAGVIMWIGGGCAMFALALGVAMRAMIAEERRQRRRGRRTPQAAGA